MINDESITEDICPKCGVRTAHLFGSIMDIEGKNDHYFCNLCEIGWLADDPLKFQIKKEDF